MNDSVMNDSHEISSEETQSLPSKSQRKREMHALQALGESLLRLQPSQLKKLPLSQDLKQAILDTQAIGDSKHGALKRQRQFIGKLMRHEDVAAIEQGLADRVRPTERSDDKELSRESKKDWIQVLTADATHGMSQLLSEYPEIDRQTLRNCLRNIQRAKSEQQAQRARSKLSTFLNQQGVL